MHIDVSPQSNTTSDSANPIMVPTVATLQNCSHIIGQHHTPLVDMQPFFPPPNCRSRYDATWKKKIKK